MIVILDVIHRLKFFSNATFGKLELVPPSYNREGTGLYSVDSLDRAGLDPRVT
jgi:hypothetical protein